MSQNNKPVMSVEELEKFLNEKFSQINQDGQCFFIEEAVKNKVVMRLEAKDKHLRPGGTISGPTMFTLADYAAFVVILANSGPIELAVTTNLNINFLRKPEPYTLICTAEIIKYGQRLIVVDIRIKTPKDNDLVAHAIATYSIPPKSS